MPLTFHKMHGLGNDFVVLDMRRQNFRIDRHCVVAMADRRTGIGCDQVLVLREPAGAGELANFEIWNADGSSAEQCGNGVRCLGLYLRRISEAPHGLFKLGGPAGIVEIECLDDGLVRVDMGKPEFAAHRVPVLLDLVDHWCQLPFNGKLYSLGVASMGNPHALMIVEDIDSADVAGLGAIISTHSAFPQGCNAGFAEIIDRRNIRLRVFERGSAETRACGSGACAAVSILRRADLVDETVKVTQTGGDLIISWTGEEKTVIMKGPATYVFKGIWHE